jgi:NhaP-type Na+/H+ or K+/H+ antiporter
MTCSFEIDGVSDRNQCAHFLISRSSLCTTGWGWNLCMTFGAILSATDPVAVAGLFNALGAPPRMQMHISGESLLNDGSSVLLYNIFSQRFFYGMNVEGFGQDIGWGAGFEMFFRLTFGGALIGLAFGLGTVFMLKFLNRRLSPQENVVQVVLTVTAAYMAYFVAEILCQCSGIISTITCGLTVKVLGITLVHDVSLMLNFWRVLGELLNT